MDLRVLRYFLTVAREESIMKAADVLHVTQPTLSRQLKDLEEEFGSPLFIRGNRAQGIVLTEKGMLLRRRAEELLTLADRTQEEMLRSDDILQGTITIGGGESAAMRIIAATASEIHSLHPDIRFDFFSGNAEDVKEKLDQGLLDFGVFIGSTTMDRYHTLHLPDNDSWGILVHESSPHAGKTYVTVQDLMDEPLLVSAQKGGAEAFSQWHGISPDNLNIVGSYNLLYNASLLVSEGYGSALCLKDIINTTGTNLRFVPLEPAVDVHLTLAWKKYQSLNKLCDYFLSALKDKIAR